MPKADALEAALVLALLVCVACPRASDDEVTPPVVSPASVVPTESGDFVSWREHIVDDVVVGGVAIRGGDGLAIADIDGDGRLDIVSVHEADTEYDGAAEGHVRVAFGGASADAWERATLAAGAEAAAAEDVELGDLDRDGDLDVVVACELAHLLYLENPGTRGKPWLRAIPDVTKGRGSFIRVAVADFDGDGTLEVVAANKGAQNPPESEREQRPISLFRINGDPLDASAWNEQVLGRVAVPINVRAVDLDGDGDLDVLAGSRNEMRVLWFENAGGLRFVEHPIAIAGTAIPDAERPAAMRNGSALVTGFNVDVADLNGDGRLDVLLAEGYDWLVWIEQPDDAAQPWPLRAVGSIGPDVLAGLALLDVDGDADLDAIVGGYSMGPRDRDGDVTAKDPLGRLAWFEQRADGDWVRHEISRRKRGMFDEFVAIDLDADGDLDIASTRGNSAQYDGVFWLEQVRAETPAPAFVRARKEDSAEVP